MISQVDARIDEFDTQAKYLMQDVKKIGPNLKEIKAKLRKDWIPVWLSDPQTALVMNARVAAKNTATGTLFKTVTTDTGNFTLTRPIPSGSSMLVTTPATSPLPAHPPIAGR